MSFVGNLLGDIFGGITGAKQQANAIKDASQTQANAAQLGVDEVRRQFDAMQQAVAPYMKAGVPALTAQQNLIGLNGAGPQSSAIDALKASPQYRALTQAGQDSILANASATGGLRGGNVQAALAQFQPALLSQLINDQFSRLGGITQLGQNSAVGVGSAGMQTGANIAQLLQQQGAATAGGQIAAGSTPANAFNSLLGIGGFAAGLGAFNGLGSGSNYDATALRAAASARQGAPASGLGNFEFSPSPIPPNLGLLPYKF